MASSIVALVQLAFFFLFATTSASPVVHYLNSRTTDTGFVCHNITVPVTLQQTATKNYTLENYDAAFMVDVQAFKLFRSGTYNVSATYCAPPNNSSGKVKDTIQLLSHGGTFRKEMWDFPYKPEIYSWVRAMNAAGYPTFAWDTIGCGASEHPDGLFEVLTQTAVETAKTLAGMLKAGHFGGTKYRVAYVGFSIQSVAGVSLASQYPNAVDAMLLHGYTWNVSNAYPGFLAGLQVPVNSLDNPAWKNFSSYYQTQPSRDTRQAVAFYGDFDKDLLPTDFAMRDMDSVGQAVSFGYHLVSAPQYSGPFFLANGNQDSSYCGEKCGSKPYAAYDKMPAASDIDIKVYDQAGHAIQLHSCAQQLQNDTIAFLQRNGM